MLKDIDWKGFVAEFVGTFLLTMTVGMSAGDPLAVGGSLWLGMMITIFRSGAQFNPAVTLSIITKHIVDMDIHNERLIVLLLNIPVQIAAGLVGGSVAWGVGKETFYFKVDSSFKTSQAFFVEMLFTMLLCMNVHQAGKAKHGLLLEGGMIALTLTTCAYTAGHVTRNCLNPAVEIGLDVAHYGNKHESHSLLWLYIVAPICGGIGAAIIARFRAALHKKEFRTSMELNLLVNT